MREPFASTSLEALISQQRGEIRTLIAEVRRLQPLAAVGEAMLKIGGTQTLIFSGRKCIGWNSAEARWRDDEQGTLLASLQAALAAKEKEKR